MTAAVFYHDTRLPWSENPEDRRRLRTIMTTVLVVMLLLSVAVPLITISDRFIDRVQEVPARFARLIVEEKPPPPPPPREEAASRPEQKPEPVAQEPQPVNEPQPRTTEPAPQAAARERAARSGLLAMSRELADMRSATITKELETLPLQGRSAVAARREAPEIRERDHRGSGGIDTSTLARDTGDTRLAGRETTRVEAPDGAARSADPASTAARGMQAARTSEEIQIVFDRNKGSLNTLYNRALRVNPALAGKVVLRLTIAPGGEVTDCELVSSELGDPELERRLVARVMLFDFGAKDVAATAITYPIDFFPG